MNLYKNSHESIKGMLYIESIGGMLFLVWNVTIYIRQSVNKLENKLAAVHLIKWFYYV